LWDRENLSPKQIAERFNLTERRIQQILRTNHAFVPIDREWEKRKRIHILKTEIAKKERSNKDKADLLNQLRTEIEGEKSLIDQSKHYIQVVHFGDKTERAGSGVSKLDTQPATGNTSEIRQ